MENQADVSFKITFQTHNNSQADIERLGAALQPLGTVRKRMRRPIQAGSIPELGVVAEFVGTSVVEGAIGFFTGEAIRKIGTELRKFIDHRQRTHPSGDHVDNLILSFDDLDIIFFDRVDLVVDDLEQFVRRASQIAATTLIPPATYGERVPVDLVVLPIVQTDTGFTLPHPPRPPESLRFWGLGTFNPGRTITAVYDSSDLIVLDLDRSISVPRFEL